MIKPANVHLQLRKEEASLLILAFKSGLVNLGAFQATMEQAFGDNKNREKHNDIMTKLFKLEDELLRQILKETKEDEANPIVLESTQVKSD